MLPRVILIALVASAAAEKVRFDDYKVYRIIPTSAEQLEVLRGLENSDEGYSYWKGPSQVSRPADLMVAPSQLSSFNQLMDAVDMRYSLYINNVQKLIDSENPKTRSASFDWTRYHTLEEIYSWLESLPDKYPGKVEVIDAGLSHEKRVIKGVKLSFGADKPGVFLEGGIHACEWIGTATVTYLLNEFLTSGDPAVRQLAESYDWYLFPLFNPDGYVYAHSTDRLWRKTMSKSDSCMGVDPNRNWGFNWMNGGASQDPCSWNYAGKSAFSESETRTMSEYLRSIGDKLFAYIAFHSYAEMLIFPYGHTTQHLDNYDESMAIATKAIDALAKRHGTKYVAGNIAETIYTASGTSIDWAKVALKLPLSFIYELRDRSHGFILPAEHIIPNGQEVLDSLIAMFKEATRFGYPKPRQ